MTLPRRVSLREAVPVPAAVNSTSKTNAPLIYRSGDTRSQRVRHSSVEFVGNLRRCRECP
jgi:hypothetical protein